MKYKKRFQRCTLDVRLKIPLRVGRRAADRIEKTDCTRVKIYEKFQNKIVLKQPTRA